MAPNLSDLLISISRRKTPVSQRLDFGDVCLVCDKSLSESMFFKQYHVCENCNFHYTMDARQRINWITDPDTFQESDKLVYSADPIGFKTRMTYKTKLSGDSERTGLTEAAVTGNWWGSGANNCIGFWIYGRKYGVCGWRKSSFGFRKVI